MKPLYVKHRSVFENINWSIIGIWLLLVIIGWMNIYSSVSKVEFINIFDLTERYGKQMLWIGVSLIVGFLILLIDVRSIPAFSYLLYLFVIVMLVAVLIFGTEINSSKSWFQFGSFAIQPAEFAKLATALALSKFMSNMHFNIKSGKSLMAITGIIALPFFLMLLQPDLGTAIVLFAFVMMFHRFGLNRNILYGIIIISFLSLLALLYSEIVLSFIILGVAIVLSIIFRNKLKDVLLIYAIAAAATLFIFAVDISYNKGLKPHQKERIEVYLSNLQGVDKDIRSIGYNFYQSKVAIGSGGFTGKGFLNGTQTKMDFIPEQDTDFIFCTIGEEWGFLGSLLLITLYLWFIFKIIKSAELQRSIFSKTYGYSFAALLLFHFIVNVGMTIGLMPVIGIPLPFISYGGSSMWTFSIMVFIFVKLDMHRNEVIG